MSDSVISVRDLGIRFKQGKRKRKPSLKDAFGSAQRRQSAKQPEFWALRDISFDVRQGESIGVIGRNGQGKSTLLKIVAGVLLPDEGSVKVSGGVSPLIELTGGFEGDLTVRDNVYLTAGLHGLRRGQVDAEFDDIIEFSEIGDFVDTPYKFLSSGMKVRIAFAVMSRLDEPILLVDEVLAVGDAAFRKKCYSRIDDLLSDNKTLFFVSHSDRDLKRFCDRGLYLDKGKLVMDAPIRDAFKRYNSDHGIEDEKSRSSKGERDKADKSENDGAARSRARAGVRAAATTSRLY